jgi:uncharacterized protein
MPMMRRTFLRLTALTACPALLAAGGSVKAGPAVDEAYRASIDKWKAELVEDLKANWLPLAGLFWLKPGANSFGTDRACDMVLPEGSAPARAGTFQLNGGEVNVRIEPGVSASIAGKLVANSRMEPDDPGKPTVLEMGRLRMHIIRRGERTGVRLKDLDNAALRGFRPLEFFPIDTRYRITAKWVPEDGRRKINVSNVLGDVPPTAVPGEARFTIDGRDVRLVALGGDEKKGLFFVFSDATSRADTYPSGRFLDTDAVSNGRIVLDFNKAYNPPCAVTPFATCPLAPRENRLSVSIPAGEKYDRSRATH